MGGDVPLDVHRHERRQLDDAGVDAAAGAGVPGGHRVDEPALEVAERLGLGGGVDPVGVHAGVDRAGHEGEAGGLRGVVRGGEQRDGREHRDGGLADGDDVGVGPEVPQRLHHVLDVLVEAEPAVLDRDVARVVPVDDEHVVVGQQRADGGPDQGGEVPGHGPDDQHPGLAGDRRLPEVQQGAERRGQHRPLGHRGQLAVDRHHVDAEVGAVVGGTSVGDDVAGRPQVADGGRAGERGGQRAQRLRGQLGGSQGGCACSTVQLVGAVEHGDLPVAARER